MSANIFGRERKATPLLTGETSHSQFGYSHSNRDIDDNGFQIFLVGSPGVSSPNHPQIGVAELYFCPENNGKCAKVSFTAPTSESTTPVYEGFGNTVALADLNSYKIQDAIICGSSGEVKMFKL